jgi:Sec-independent protein translocase protein TatA
MFGLSLAELAVILTVALIVLGPGKLPEVARHLAKAYGHLLKLNAEFTRTLDDSITLREPKVTLKLDDNVTPLMPKDRPEDPQGHKSDSAVTEQNKTPGPGGDLGNEIHH